MDLLPRSHTEFSQADYWEKFFKKRGGKAFEWYGEYPELCGILHKYIKPTDKTLVIGCGNSELSENLYDVGYKNIENIDISEVVIRQMSERNSTRRSDMKFKKMDMLQMEYSDGEFSVVLDKGTLDALMTDETPDTIEKVEKMFSEISRVLRLGGRYLCVSLAQKHILNKALHYFSQEGWMVRICRVVKEHDNEQEFQMPVFVYVFTKFKKMPNMKQILEVSYFDDKMERLDDTDQVKAAVEEMQHYGVIKNQLNKKDQLDEHISLDLYSSASNTPRYTLHVVDSPKRLHNKFAIFIVPEGREPEWLFSTDEGRRELAGNAGFSRLVIVTLHRDHQYGSLDNVKSELSAKVMELAPPNLGNKQVPFLSLGDDINTRTIRHQGHSDVSGDYVVEDVDNNGTTLRRLVFLSSKHIVQTEAQLVRESSKGKGNKKKTKMVVNTNLLTIGYYSYMVAGLAFMEDFHTKIESQVDLLLVGLGGGGLPMFIHRNYKSINIELVEIDPAMLSIASDWFGFSQDERMKVVVADGLAHIKQLSQSGDKRDIVILDVDSKDPSLGMSCPPESFVQPEVLENVNKILSPQGVFMLNLVCRNQSLRESVIANLKAVFPHVYSRKIPDDVNEAIYALPASRKATVELNSDGQVPKQLYEATRILQEMVQTQSRMPARDLPRLATKLEGLALL